MSVTVRESILENIKTTIQGITVAGGYANTIASVQRWDMRGKSSAASPYVTIATGNELMDPSPYPLYTCRMTVFLDVWVRQTESDTKKTDTLFSSLAGDIKKALMLDCKRGGYADNTVLRSISPFEPADGAAEAGIVVEIEIVYKHRKDDPAAKT